MANKPSHSAGRYSLELGGVHAGFLKKVTLPGWEGEVATHSLATTNHQAKQITSFKATDLKFTVGMGMSANVKDWINAALDMQSTAMDCSVVIADFDSKAMNRVDLYGCHITEVSIPEANSTSKDGAYLDVTVKPSHIRFEDGKGDKITGNISAKQKNLALSNFKFTISNTKLPTARVSAVKGLKATLKTQLDAIGQAVEYSQHYTAMEFGDLDVTFSGADVAAWQTFAKSWFVDGHRKVSDEMTASLEFLDPTLGTVATIDFEGVVLKKLAHAEAEAFQDKLWNGTATFCYEKFQFRKAAID